MEKNTSSSSKGGLSLFPKIRENLSQIPVKIAVMSGKGGVGKTTVCAWLALSLKKLGFKVAVFDADFTGPNIAYAIKEKVVSLKAKAVGTEDNYTIIPPEVDGIKVVSSSMILDEGKALIWRGPLKFKLFQELLAFSDLRDVDILLIDLPPGTGDESLNLAQMIPDAKVIIVYQPATLAVEDVKRSMDFAKTLNLEILAIVENFSYAVCPKCGEKFDIFDGAKLKVEPDLKLPILKEKAFEELFDFVQKKVIPRLKK